MIFIILGSSRRAGRGDAMDEELEPVRCEYTSLAHIVQRHQQTY